MTPPHTIKFEAKADVWTIAFDGVTWSGTGPGFEDYILPMLTDETPWHQGTHIFVDSVAKRVLDRVFPKAGRKFPAIMANSTNCPHRG